MGLWTALGEVAATAGRVTGVCVIVDAIKGVSSKVGSLGKPVTFTVALIALAAKMAKADGIVSTDELETFRRIITVPPSEEANVERLFALAQGDTAGFETYAARIADLAEGDLAFLTDVIEGLFHIAAADGYVHEREMAFLETVADIFKLPPKTFDRVAAGFVRRKGPDPYRILGVLPEASDDEIKRAWRELAMENHPDRHAARGVPAEFMAVLTDRLQQINAAYEAIRMERGMA